MRNNPCINWTTGEVFLIGTPFPQHNKPEVIEQRYLLPYLRVVERDESKYAARIYVQQRNAATLQRVLGEDHPHILMLTLSTALAQATEKVEQKLPPQYAKYTKVFNEPKDRELPPWWPFDHGIDLKETFVPKVAKTYYYSTRGPYFIFPHFPYQLYTSFPFLLQWLRSDSFSRLSQRSRCSDLDLQLYFPS